MPVVSTYQQAVEPTDLTPGITWLRNDGTAAIRKLDLTWNEIGKWQLPSFNNLPLTGGTMLGAILGQHGLAPLANPAFTGTATLGGVDLAPKQWTTDQLTALQTTISNQITSLIGGTTGNITIGSNLAIGYGTVADGGTIPLPIYSDNKRAALAEVWSVLVSNNSTPHSSGAEATSWVDECFANASLIVTCKIRITSGGGGNNLSGNGTANYIIVCKR